MLGWDAWNRCVLPTSPNEELHETASSATSCFVRDFSAAAVHLAVQQLQEKRGIPYGMSALLVRDTPDAPRSIEEEDDVVEVGIGILW